MESRGAMEKVMTVMMLRVRRRASVLKAECGRMEVMLRQRYHSSTDWFNRCHLSVGIVFIVIIVLFYFRIICAWTMDSAVVCNKKRCFNACSSTVGGTDSILAWYQ